MTVNRIGDGVMLMTKANKWNSFMEAVTMFSEDFMKDGRFDESNRYIVLKRGKRVKKTTCIRRIRVDKTVEL